MQSTVISSSGVGRVLVVAALLSFAGCSSYPAVSEHEQLQRDRQAFLDEVTSQGGSAEQKDFEKFTKKGQAWVIKIPGGKISDEMIKAMTQLGRVAELNLSGSTITDEQLLKLDENNVGYWCLILDLSNTGISDNSFANLKNFHVVQNANLKGTKVTKLGVEQFKEAYMANKEVPAMVKKGLNVEL